MPNRWIGPAAIAGAALLWATDAIVRWPALRSIDALSLVTLDHALALLILFPVILARRGRALFKLRSYDVLALAVIGLGGSALGTVLFTRSFSHTHPSVAILLQKLQPILTISLSVLFLGERRKRAFFGWAAVALAASITLALPDFNDPEIAVRFSIRSLGAIFALAAAALWAISTVIGKQLLRNVPPDIATFWRYAFGLAGLLLISLATRGEAISASLSSMDGGLLFSIAYMALIPGLLAMLLYYHGLRRTQATTVTLVELLFPVLAIALNWIFLGASLTATQLILSVVLLTSVVLSSLD